MVKSLYFTCIVSRRTWYRLRSQSDLSCQVMAYQVGRRGRGGRRAIANAEVMRLMQRLEARMDVIEGDRQRDPNDVSEYEYFQ